MTPASFDIERVQQEAANGLPAACVFDFLRLTRALVHGPSFQWLLVEVPNELLRNQVMEAVEQVLRAARMGSSRLPLSGKVPDVGALEARLIHLAKVNPVVHVVGPSGWFNPERWDAFNVRRERIASQAKARLVFWLDTEAIADAASQAPDLWAWRSGVYSFMDVRVSGASATAGSSTLSARPSGPGGIDNRSMVERHQRIREIREWLGSTPPPPDELLAAPLRELGQLLFSLGEMDAALAHWRDHVLPYYQRHHDERAVALTQARIAEILQFRGQFDEALHIHRDELLPVVERLGDMRLRAVIQGKIAGILQTRGELDESLRINREEVLPVLQRLGDVYLQAVTQSKIANILERQGHPDEALRILREDVMPMFERLGDVRSCAVTQGQIADILQSRGQLDEALRIHREEELPVYERLGDVRERAIALGKIADILQSRGQFAEALRIRREQELPALERLGNVRLLAVERTNLAHLLWSGFQQKEEAEKLFRQALASFQQMGLPEAEQLARQMRDLGLWVPGSS